MIDVESLRKVIAQVNADEHGDELLQLGEVLVRDEGFGAMLRASVKFLGESSSPGSIATVLASAIIIGYKARQLSQHGSGV